MHLRQLGRSDVMISSLVFGTCQVSDHWSGVTEVEFRRALVAAFDAGVVAFDTARSYADGRAERLLGSCLGKWRHQVAYLTKVEACDLRYAQVIASCEQSLKNLATEYIDLYEIHWPAGTWNSAKVPIAETMAALNDLKQQGKIRAIGVGNFALSELIEACQYAQIDSIQIPHSLFWCHVAEHLRPYCDKHGISLLAYSPLAQGLLARSFTIRPWFADHDVRLMNKLFQGKHYGRTQRAMVQLEALARQLGITPAQLALAWVLAQPNTCAIVGVDTVAQAKENVAAMSLQLAEEALSAAERLGRMVTDYLDRDDPVMWTWQRPKKPIRLLRKAIFSLARVIKNVAICGALALCAGWELLALTARTCAL